MSQGSADRVGVAAEPGQREHVASHPVRFDACADDVDPTRDFVARHARDRRQVRIKPEAAEYVGEIDAACFNANPHLAGFGFGIGCVLNLENLRWTGFGDPNLPHGLDLRFAPTRAASITSSKSYSGSAAPAPLLLTLAHADLSAAPRRHCDQRGTNMDVRAAVAFEAKKLYPQGYKTPKPYIRVVPQPH